MSAPRRLPLSPSPSDFSRDFDSTVKSRTLNVTPQSPVSPPLMSVATKSYVSSYGNNQHTDEMAQRPRSPTSNYMQQSQRMNSFASQESNLKRPSPSVEENEHRDKRQKLNAGEDRMDVDVSIAPTDHDRKNVKNTESSDDRPAGLQKSEQGQESDRTSIDRLQKDFGEAFLLRRSSIPRSRPDPKQHLLATYGLVDLLKSVARTDPLSGEKINKLRKSYEGQIKTFGLAGRNKPFKVDREEDEPGPLRSLAIVQDAQWDDDQGKSSIGIDASFRAKLEQAMQMQPGKVKDNAMWEDLLGHEKPRPIVQQQPAPATRVLNGVSRPQLPYALAGPAVDKRSTRGKKRSYGDDSYVGYGEGYSDGDEPGEADDEYSARKRKKDHSTASGEGIT